MGIASSKPKRAALVKVIQNANCGLFYCAATFHDIPGPPIVYWTSSTIHEAFASGSPLSQSLNVRQGLAAGDYDRFLRQWWEVCSRSIKAGCQSIDSTLSFGGK